MKKIIDCHCHIYPNKIAQKAVEGIGKFYDLDMHAHGTCEDMVVAGDKAGISHYLVFSVATTPKQTESINNFIAEEVKKSDGKFDGLGTVHPDGDIQGDLKTIVDLGLKGVKIHPDFQGFKIDDYRYLKVYEKCEEMGLPVLLHTGDTRYDFSNPNRMKAVLDIFTSLTVIGAHFGGWSCWEQAAEELSGYKNFYVDTSSSFYALSDEKIKKIISLYGTDRIVFGTDYPMWSAEDEIKRFNSLGLSEEDSEKILHKNAVKIFGLEKDL